MKHPFFAALALTLALPAAALTPEAESFVRSIKPALNPQDVSIAESHGEVSTTFQGDPAVFSLERLAAQRGTNQVRRFVATRAFIQRLQDDYEGTPLLKKDYEALYLTPSEKQLVGRKVADSL